MTRVTTRRPPRSSSDHANRLRHATREAENLRVCDLRLVDLRQGVSTLPGYPTRRLATVVAQAAYVSPCPNAALPIVRSLVTVICLRNPVSVGGACKRIDEQDRNVRTSR